MRGWSHSCDCSFRSRRYPCFGHISQKYIIRNFFTFGNARYKCLRMVFVGPFTNKDKWMSQIGLLYYWVRLEKQQQVFFTQSVEGFFNQSVLLGTWKVFSLGPRSFHSARRRFHSTHRSFHSAPRSFHLTRRRWCFSTRPEKGVFTRPATDFQT